MFDIIPWWVYWLVVGIGVSAMLYFASPILVPLWNATPRWVKVALGVVAALFTAYVKGKNDAARRAREKQAELDRQAIQKRMETDDRIQKMDKDTVHGRLSRWNRDGG